ncbi:50S ribosomal protein L1 [Candidatus Dojkabacteria bacterium]|uniref:Ribosomal protein n=1 Tax=Candidatus Dojkabacteria bacterium TaxID=2099670 RepID=A0A955ICK4_9BACT|nr:50S ribosomal protein L1 [Candidatus Dojkabacteria bacterium]
MENLDPTKKYSLAEAAELLPTLSTSKFVGSVDIDIVLNLTEKQKKESVRGSVVFSNRFGKEVTAIVFADEKDSAAALKAGAKAAGLEDLVKKVEDGKIEFDVAIATPAVMPKIARLGKVLGPKGLMPNPANGTVTADIAKAIESFKGGKQNFKMSEQGVIRMRVAKLDMSAEQIAANIMDLLKVVFVAARKLNPQPFKRITLSPTMGKGIKLDIAALSSELK